MSSDLKSYSLVLNFKKECVSWQKFTLNRHMAQTGKHIANKVVFLNTVAVGLSSHFSIISTGVGLWQSLVLLRTSATTTKLT